ncbi:MAG: MarR family transcriptional regulator [Rhodobacteraceae bacterium]|nr:MAG: MarR family transcriptional regulator [Paracoccaceae bacterium]
MFFLKDLPTREMIRGYAQTHAVVDVQKTNDALQMLRKASLLIRRLERYFTLHGLSQTQFLVLMILHRDTTKDSHLAAEICAKMDLSKPVLSTTLKTMQQRGLIVYCGKSEDARAKPLRISDTGRDLLLKLLPEYFEILQSG